MRECRRPDNDDPANWDCDYVLVTGRHRLEACKRLGLEVPAIILDETFSDDEVELMEISENLHRRELTAEQKAQQFRRYLELLQQREDAEKLSRGETVTPTTTEKGGRGKKALVTRAAEQVGISRSTAHRYVAEPKPAPEPRPTPLPPTPEQIATGEAVRFMHLWECMSELGRVQSFRELGLNYYDLFPNREEAA